MGLLLGGLSVGGRICGELITEGRICEGLITGGDVYVWGGRLNINRWLTANKLKLSVTKTEFMLIGSRQKLNNLPFLPSLNVNDVPLNHSQCSKSFGVLIDENLTWKNHVDALSKNIASGIGAIKRINHCLPSTALHNVYYGLVQ